jgi:hypothetical protein
MMKTLKRVTKSVVPRQWHPWEQAKRKVERAAGGKVLSGPFRGMRSLTSPDDFVDYTMLLGTYELELHPTIERVAGAGFRTIVDVGAAQGWYAIGFARLCPGSSIIAFESNPEGREQLLRTAKANGVEGRITLKGFCSGEDLQACLSDPPRTLVFMDIDGGEMELLDPARVPGLSSCHIVLEEHDFLVPGIVQVVKDRFGETHDLEWIPQQLRTLAHLPVRSPFLDHWLLALMNERPAGNSWVAMRPRL